MKQIFWVLSLVAILVSCGKEQQEEDKQLPSLGEQIVGKWKNQEVNNGVEYFITFHYDHTISQVFVDPNGRARLYNGTWNLADDSLTIEDRGGVYRMLITEMMDSTMVMVRSDSMALVFLRYPDEEEFLPAP